MESFSGPEVSYSQWYGSGSGRICIHLGPWIRILGHKIEGKAEFNQQFYFLSLKQILFFFLAFKRWFEINLVIFCPGSGLEPHPDLHWPNFVDPDPHTINADHWLFNHSFLASKRIKNKFVSKNSVKNVGNFFFYFFLPVFVLNEFLYESVCHLLT